MLIRLLKKHKRFITFAIIGGVNTLVDFLVFTGFYELAGLAIDLCHALGYSAGLLCSFILNRSFTFKREMTTGLGTQIIRFLIVNGISLLISTVLIKWLYMAGLNEYIAKILVICLTMVINYLGYKLFVYVIRDKADQ